jgi:hypothetical protein
MKQLRTLPSRSLISGTSPRHLALSQQRSSNAQPCISRLEMRLAASLGFCAKLLRLRMGALFMSRKKLDSAAAAGAAVVVCTALGALGALGGFVSAAELAELAGLAAVVVGLELVSEAELIATSSPSEDMWYSFSHETHCMGAFPFRTNGVPRHSCWGQTVLSMVKPVIIFSPSFPLTSFMRLFCRSYSFFASSKDLNAEPAFSPAANW